MGAINIDPDPDPPPADSDSPPVAGQPAAYLQVRFERAREVDRLKHRAALPLSVALVVLGMAIAFFGLQPFGVVVASGGAVLAGAAGMYGLIRMPFDSLIWARGIEGERRTGDILSSLEAEGFITLYNRRVPTARGDIDALTIGPTGLFTIESKNWSGKLDVRGDRLFVGEHERTWAVEQLYREAMAVQLALGEELTAHRVTVTPCCAPWAASRAGPPAPSRASRSPMRRRSPASCATGRRCSTTYRFWRSPRRPIAACVGRCHGRCSRSDGGRLRPAKPGRSWSEVPWSVAEHEAAPNGARTRLSELGVGANTMEA